MWITAACLRMNFFNLSEITADMEKYIKRKMFDAKKQE
jgi:hypothetical protein